MLGADMARLTGRTSAAVLCFALLATISAQTPPASGSLFGSNRIASAGVIATWLVRTTPAGNELRVLVLWRGSPGWFMRTGTMRTSGGGYPGGYRTKLDYGGVTLDLDVKDRPAIATLQGQTVDLTNGNVIFVDNVDSAGGGAVAGTLLANPALPDQTSIDVIVRREPRIIEFLRCEQSVSATRAQEMMQTICKELKVK
jgi:hypothetical protein